MPENVDQNNSEYGHFDAVLVLVWSFLTYQACLEPWKMFHECLRMFQNNLEIKQQLSWNVILTCDSGIAPKKEIRFNINEWAILNREELNKN